MTVPPRFLDPKNDFVFKKIFGNHPRIVKSFLNGILPLSCPIETIEYLPSEQVPEIPEMKRGIVDVKCIDQKDRIFIVEMQLQWTKNFTQRLLYGSSRAYVQQIKRGKNYHTLCPVYGLALVNEIFDTKTDEWFHHYKMMRMHDQKSIEEGIELIFIEIPKFTPQSKLERHMGILWLRFLKELDEIGIIEEFKDYPDILEAADLAQESAFSLEELEYYEKIWDAVRCEKTKMHGAQEKGIEIGREIGAKQKAHEIANILLGQGLSLDSVSQITGLAVEEIKKSEIDSL